ncbi:hypothetical protein [Streptomyces lasiicapitis]|nr:hypothetical protein [Streptomyces lasiicapitis]
MTEPTRTSSALTGTPPVRARQVRLLGASDLISELAPRWPANRQQGRSR